MQRALDLALDEAGSPGKTQTLGPLIHNPQVVSRLHDMGVGVAHSAEDIDADCIIIRSHGVTPEVMRQVEATGSRIVNATCPHVMRAQHAAARLAKECGTVLVVGESSHPEVEGLVAHAREAGGNVAVVNAVEDIPEDLDQPVGVVVQTTQSRAKFDCIVDHLHTRKCDLKVIDTICDATSQRQDAAAQLAAKVDAMVVIGGRNSSNTTRLYEICSGISPRSFHIETPGELQKELFDGCATVGVTAGASTPEDQIRAVEELLESW